MTVNRKRKSTRTIQVCSASIFSMCFSSANDVEHLEDATQNSLATPGAPKQRTKSLALGAHCSMKKLRTASQRSWASTDLVLGKGRHLIPCLRFFGWSY